MHKLLLAPKTGPRDQALRTLVAMKLPAKDLLPMVEESLRKFGGNELLKVGAEALGSMGGQAKDALSLLDSFPPELAAEVAKVRVLQRPVPAEHFTPEPVGGGPLPPDELERSRAGGHAG